MESNVIIICSILSAVGSLTSGITGVILVLRGKKEGQPVQEAVRRWPVWLAAILAVVLGVVAYALWPRPCRSSARYEFESESIAWSAETYENSQGITAVERSSKQAKACRYSLQLTADLEGGHPHREKGEAFVEIPVQNLENKPITAWIYVPRAAVGDHTKPNGVQVFVKDSEWRSEYGSWWNITPGRTDSWQQVTLTPSNATPPDGWRDEGFDPTQVRAVGVKVATGADSTAKYQGPVWLDSVDWP